MKQEAELQELREALSQRGAAMKALERKLGHLELEAQQQQQQVG